jgi:hypothetical protein
MSVTITQGTSTQIFSKLNAGTEIQVIKLDVGSGTAVADFGGTITAVNNIAGGTVQINPTPTITPLTFGTLGTAGGSFFATISTASGAGTKHYISGVDIIVQSGTADIRVLVGTAIEGGSVLAAGCFTPNGGISKNFNPTFVTGTNSELTYHFVGAGTAFINVSYWKA